MEKIKLHLLILEDNPDDAELAVKELEREGFIVEWSRVYTKKTFKESLAEKPDLILVDYKLPSFTGMDAIKMHRKVAPEIPLIIVSGTIGEEIAVGCMKAGATDYVLKDKLTRLGPVVKRALEEAKTHRERKHAVERIEHLNSVLKAIRAVNQLVVVERDRDSLLQKTCDALIEARGYEAAWLGFMTDGENFVLVNGSGFGKDVSRFIEHVMGGEHPPCIRNALAQKYKIVVVDKSRECGGCFFKSACIGKEAAIIRIEYAGRLFGLLAILFAPQVTTDEEENGLLMEVAGDIAFALHDMEMEKGRKQAEEALLESETKHRLLAENTVDCIWQINMNLEFTYINQAIFPFLGFTPEEWIGSKLPEHCSPEEMEKTQAIISDILANLPDKTEAVFETSFYHKNGEEVPAEVSGKILLDDTGNPIYFQGTTRNITERKQAEEKLQKKIKELEGFNRLAVGRELKMIELKKEINSLLEESGNEPKYEISE